jgi:hypothetical protein
MRRGGSHLDLRSRRIRSPAMSKSLRFMEECGRSRRSQAKVGKGTSRKVEMEEKETGRKDVGEIKTSAEALIIIPVVEFPFIKPLLIPSEGLKYPAVNTHLPSWKVIWERISKTYPTPVVSVDRDSCGVERGISCDSG